MPYTISNPPKVIQKLPKGAQKIWIRVFNAYIKDHPGDEAGAIFAAWGAVKQKYRKVGDKWVRKGEEGDVAPEIWIPGTDESKAVSPWIEVPDEDATYRYVVQAYFQGKSYYNDLRFEWGGRKFMLGFELATQVVRGIEEDVETLAQAVQEIRRGGDVSDIDWRNGEWLATTAGGTEAPVYVGIVSMQKAPHPNVWRTVEGIKGDGVFLIVDKGEMEYGALKPYFVELFPRGEKLSYRLVFRPLSKAAFERLGLQSKDDPNQKVAWLMIRPLDQTPYVLTEGAMDLKWLPPPGVSALPRKVKQAVPDELQYWGAPDVETALELREELVSSKAVNVKEVMNVGEKVVGSGPLVLQYQHWKGPQQDRQLWSIRMDIGGTSLLAAHLEGNPLEVGEVSALWEHEGVKSSMELEGEIKPGHVLNSTKNTPSFIKVLDRGTCEVLENAPLFKKVRFYGKKLEGLWVATRSSLEDVWMFRKSTLPSI